MALGIDTSSEPSEIKFNRVANGFLHTATGNRLAQHVAAVNTLASAEVGTTGSPWESCADDALAEIIRGAQAAMQHRAEAKAAAAAEEAAAAAEEAAAAAEEAAAAAEAASSPRPGPRSGARRDGRPRRRAGGLDLVITCLGFASKLRRRSRLRANRSGGG